jgi:hypothetical protein
VASVELADILASELLHQARHGADVGWRDEKMDVVVHQHVGMQRDVSTEQGFVQQMQIAPPVDVIEEAGQAIVAALDDMLRDMRKIEPGQACHAASFISGVAWHQWPMPDSRGGNLPDVMSANRHEVNLTPYLNDTTRQAWIWRWN